MNNWKGITFHFFFSAWLSRTHVEFCPKQEIHICCIWMADILLILILLYFFTFSYFYVSIVNISISEIPLLIKSNKISNLNFLWLKSKRKRLHLIFVFLSSQKCLSQPKTLNCGSLQVFYVHENHIHIILLKS